MSVGGEERAELESAECEEHERLRAEFHRKQLMPQHSDKEGLLLLERLIRADDVLDLVSGEIGFERCAAQVLLYRVREVMQKHVERSANVPRKSGITWTQMEEGQLISAFERGVDVRDIAATLERSITAINARLVKLGLIDAELVPQFRYK